MGQFQILFFTFPYYVFEQYSCKTCHTLFTGGHDLQILFEPVDVSSPDGSFDILRSFFYQLNEFRIQILILALQRP